MTIEEVRKLFKGNVGYLFKDDNGWKYVYDSCNENGETIYVEVELNNVHDNNEPYYTRYDC